MRKLTIKRNAIATFIVEGGFFQRGAAAIRLLEPRIAKSPLRRMGSFLCVGGVDGTRTRDPRRDRPVF